MEQVELGATVLPEESPHYIGVQVGRYQYLCEVEALSAKQGARLEKLYRAGRVRLGYPGEFYVAPACFREQRLRCRVVVP